MPQPLKSRASRAILLCFSLGVLGFGLNMLITQIAFHARSVSTTATVVDYHQREHCSRGVCTTYYPPTVTFTASNGTEVTAQVGDARNTKPPQVGGTITVAYDNSDPSIVRDPAASGTTWTSAILLTGFGLVTTTIAVMTFTRQHRAAREIRSSQPPRRSSQPPRRSSQPPR